MDDGDIRLQENMPYLRLKFTEADNTELEELARACDQAPSKIARTALLEGIRILKLDIARQRFIINEFTLAGAANYAGISIYDMAEYMTRRNVPFFRQSLKALAQDVKMVKSALREGH